MNGYNSEFEDTAIIQQQNGGIRRQKRTKTLKQRMVAKARRDAGKLIKLTDTLPHEVKASGFHYNDEGSREVLEESRELGNQTDDESESSIQPSPNPVIKEQSIAYRIVANKRPGGKPVVQIKGLKLSYDNTQSPFVNASYLDNGKITTGVLNAATKSPAPISLSPLMAQQPRKKIMRKRKTAKRQP